jgi:ABC-type spermidine/putrescine transport system permease subunit II
VPDVADRRRSRCWRLPAARGARIAGRAALLGLVAFVIFGPLANLLPRAFAEKWYFPNRIPQEFDFTFCARVFSPRGNALASHGTSIWIATLTVVVSLSVAIPAGYALVRVKLRGRGLILLTFPLPQAVPILPM